MAITITSNLTTISECESTTGWVCSQTNFIVDTDVYLQNTASLSAWVDIELMSLATYAITSTDMSNGEHLYCWMFCSGVVDTRVNGGYRLYASDGTNDATWYVGGNDTHGTGWQLFTVSLDAIPDLSTGTLNRTAITAIGVAMKTLTPAISKGPTDVNNVFWDVIRYGTGLSVISASTDGVTLEDIFLVDNLNANKFGIVQKNTGAYIINGALIFGDTATGTVDVLIDGEVILYSNNDLLSSTFNTIQLLGNTTGISNLKITGSFLKANLVSTVLNLSGANLNSVLVDGSSFVNFSPVDFTASQDITNNVFDGCGIISPSTAIFSGNTVKNSSEITGFALSMNLVHNISNTIYTGNNWAFAVNPATNGDTYDEIGGNFSLNTADVYNQHITNAVTINKLNGSNVTTSATAGGTVTITASFSLSLTNIEEGAQLTIVNSSTRVELHNEIVDATGIVTYVHGGGETVDILLMSLTIDPNLSDIFDLILPNADSTIKFQMIDDPNFDNPV